jgi:hypothetical protein
MVVRFTLQYLFKLVIFPTIQLYLGFQFIRATAKTDTVMAAYDCSALWAIPFLFFFKKELLDALALNILKVLDYAHLIISPVSFVDIYQSLARKIITLIAVVHLAT